MAEVDRVPVLVYDDGTPTGAITMDRALQVASRVMLVTAHRSENLTRNVTTADQEGVQVTVHELRPNTGIRHALDLCATEEIFVAYVPHPGEHPGEQLRKIIQAAADDETKGLPVLAVNIVHPESTASGPVVELDPAHSDAGFAALFAAGLAGSLRVPLHILRLAGDRTDAALRAADALDQARQLITDNDIAVYDHPTTGDPLDTALHYANGASAIVIGIGGFTVRGRKLTAPDELPDAVLETPDGQLAHHLLQQASTDLTVAGRRRRCPGWRACAPSTARRRSTRSRGQAAFVSPRAGARHGVAAADVCGDRGLRRSLARSEGVEPPTA
jgi:hypothetical protein